jgi:dephospho-CoA kinase
MLFVGLTGGIGTGKSTAARMLVERGAVVIDADLLAREAVAPGTDGFRAVVEAFGQEVVNADGTLDRKRLAQIVFEDPERRRALEAIVHPEVRRRIAQTVADNAGTPSVVVLDSPLLIETDGHRDVQVIVVTTTTPQTAIARLVARGMDEADARARLAVQMPLEEKARKADVVLDNEGSLEDLAAQVDALWKDLRGRAHS